MLSKDQGKDEDDNDGSPADPPVPSVSCLLLKIYMGTNAADIHFES